MIVHWGIVFGWMAAVLYLSTTPVGGKVHPVWPYVAHFGMYAILSGLLVIAFARTTGLNWSATAVASVTWAGFYGLFNEVVQIYVPTREFSLADVVTNLLGALAGILLLQQLQVASANRGRGRPADPGEDVGRR